MSAKLEEKGAHNLPLIILFGAILAILFAALFLFVYDQQLNALVDQQAESLADELAKTAFASISGGLHSINLPEYLGGSTYSISVKENSIFVVSILAGRRSGSSYSAVVNSTILVEDGKFSPGGQVYFMFNGDVIIASASPIEAKAEKVVKITPTEPPEFYHFSKQFPKEAAAIAAAYFNALGSHSGENVIVVSYVWENTDSILIKIRKGDETTINRAEGRENLTKVGAIENWWVVELLENVELKDNFSWISCPSPDNAYLTGWLYSPEAVLKHLRSRTWSQVSDNLIVAIPSDAKIQASAVTTNVSTYPVWRVQFGNYNIFYQMLPWWEVENTPGFVFQSSPELKPLI
ncbi:MAG: hypothetical protein ACP5PX_01055 [Candidatus Hadarchaeum sp.]|uniref:hypothetical protein n=1 Tax=Candidatus Hadarchaeum sp. TaxID=2883567 RepID=UPI003D0A0DC7